MKTTILTSILGLFLPRIALSTSSLLSGRLASIIFKVLILELLINSRNWLDVVNCFELV